MTERFYFKSLSRKARLLFFYLNKTKTVLLETFFPRFCVNCKKEGRYLCDNCLLFLSEVSLFCPVCKKDSLYGKKHISCDGIDGLILLYDYEGVAKRLMNKINNGAFHILEEITEKFISLLEKDFKRFSLFLSFITKDETVITFIPITKEEEKNRGFSFSKVLADNFSRVLNKKTITLLKEDKNSVISFVGQENSKEKVVLFTDIWSDGKKEAMACLSLKENGFKEVWVFSVFRKIV